MLAVAVLGAVAPTLRAAEPSVLYTPNLSIYPNASASSPRVITLFHSGGSNGTMLATFDDGNTFAVTDGTGQPTGFPIYQSTDAGATWSKQPLSVVSDAVHGWKFSQQPMLLEVPRQVGGAQGLRPGTILLVGNFEAPNIAAQDLEVYESTDRGRHWSYLSSCASGGGSGHGIWEPYLQIDAYGNLDCYFSDERQNVYGYSQIIGHVTSTDGGKTWGTQSDDVGIADHRTRPGMPAVVRMSNGRYAMAFETVGQTDSQVHIKFSDDGTHWGAEDALGSLVATADGHFLGATPELTAIPPTRRYPDGVLVLDAKAYFDTNGGQTPATGNVLLINTANGAGAWSRAPAPMGLNPAPTLYPDCNNYKPGLAWTGVGNQIVELAPRLLAPGTCGIVYAKEHLAPGIQDAAVIAVAVGSDSRPWVLWKYPNQQFVLWVLTADGSSLVHSLSFDLKAGWTTAGVTIGADNVPRLLWDGPDGSAVIGVVSRNGNVVKPVHQYAAPAGTIGRAIAVGPDGRIRILWSAVDGPAALWTLAEDGRTVAASKDFPGFQGWTAAALTVGTDNDPRLLWNNDNGAIAVWTQSADDSTTLSNNQYGPFSGTHALAIASGPDGQIRLLWSATDGHINLWTMDSSASTLINNSAYGPFPGASAVSLSIGGNGEPRVLWSSTGDFMDLWSMDASGSTLLFNYSGTPVATSGDHREYGYRDQASQP
ncbi:MAG: hypothetical protein RSP_28130 [Rhodanobacter sp.]